MATVTNTIKLPDGTAPADAAVEIELVASTNGRAAGWISSSDVTILSTVRPTVTAGAWSADLTPNASIDPAGTVYKISEYANRLRYVNYILVDADGGTVHDLLTEAPATIGSSALAAHIANATDAHDATAISYAGSTGLSAANVELALDELDTEKMARIVVDAIAQGSAVEIGDGTRALQIWAEAGGPSIGSKNDSRILVEGQARWDSDDDGTEGTGLDINKPAVVLRQTGEDHKGAMIEMQQYLDAGTHDFGVAADSYPGTFEVASAGYKRVGWLLAHYDSPNPVDGIHQHMNFETCMADLATIITRFQISWGEDIALASFPNSHVRFYDDKEVRFGSDDDVTLVYDTATGRLLVSGATWRFGNGTNFIWIDQANGRLGVGPAGVASPSAPLHLERTDVGQSILARNTAVGGTTGAIVKVEAATAASRAFQSGIQTTDTVAQFSVDIDGTLAWGPGGSTARDTNLFRTAADTLRTNDSLTVDGTLTAGALAGLHQVDTYTSDDTWTKPAWAKRVTLLLIGGGSGGGSGRRGAAGTVRGGGGGGAGGGHVLVVSPASQVPATLTIDVGAAGTGGAAVTADDTSGNAGTGGSQSSAIGTGFAVRSGGTGGGAGGGAGGAAGGALSVSSLGGGAGGASQAAGGVGANGGTGGMGAGGGGAGGGITSADSPSAGGTGGPSFATNVTGGAAGTVGNNGGAGGAATNSPWGGAGGGGGGASITGAAGAGGAGGNYGSGGGGGGASLNGNNSGAGGNGVAGVVVIISEG